MDVADFVTGALSTVRTAVALTLEGLTPEQLAYRPGPESNPVGWLVWHMARMQDRGISAITGEEQLWVADRWHARYGMRADPADTGMGHDAERVSAFRAPDAATLLQHYDAVLRRTQAWLAEIEPGETDRVVEQPSPPATVGERLVSIVNGNMQHIGQASYVRGLIEERRWYPR